MGPAQKWDISKLSINNYLNINDFGLPELVQGSCIENCKYIYLIYMPSTGDPGWLFPV